MTLTLRHVAGPLAGFEERFGNERERVVIGRDPALCDVVYPPDLTIVGREHAALVRKLSGDYALDLFGDHYVAIDGVPADPGATLPSGATLTLGAEDGPRFVATVDRGRTDANLAATQAQAKPASPRQSARRARGLALASLVLAVLGLGGIGAFTWLTGEADRATVAGQLAAMRAEQRKLAAERIPESERLRLARAVFAVVARDTAGNERLVGTAWAVRPDRLATNAHVAAELGDLKPGESLLARPAGAGTEAYRISQAQAHPGFKALQAYLRDDPFFVKSYGGPSVYDAIGGYDVALLTVSPALPADSLLTVAAPERLAALAPGEAVAYAGFPYENILGSSVQPLGRTPQVQVGNITALSDFFMLPADAPQRRLIQHNLPMTGGASGSPLIDASGQVVGLVNAINTVTADGRRAPSAALINYAQRADALVDLLEGRAEARMPAERAYWARQTAAFQRGADAVIETVLGRVRPAPGAKPVLASSLELTLGTKDRVTRTTEEGKSETVRVHYINAPVKAGTRHFAIAYGKGITPILGMGLIVDGKVAQSDAGGGDPYAGLSYNAAGDGAQTLMVMTEDKDVTIVFRDYTWQVPKS